MSFTINLADVELFGSGLVRPEGVMVARDGAVWCSHGSGHCTRIRPDGRGEDLGKLGGEPNGICIDRDGSIVVANIGGGAIQRLYPDGRHETIVDTMEGRPFTTPNFPFIDSKGRIWCGNSTAMRRHFDATRFPVPDGTLCVVEHGHARIVAEGIRFTNGVALDKTEEYVYVAETMGRCILRYRIHGDGTVGRPEQYGPELGERGYPDGIAFDDAGNLWITLVMMNALAIITPQRQLRIVLEDPDGKILDRPTNICFGGDDLRTAYVGSLRGTSLPRFKAPYPGMPLIHQM